LISKVEELGFVTFSVPNWRLLNGLGYGRFSSVFSCFSEGSDEKHSEKFVMKVFRGEAIEMADFEIKVLNELSTVDRNVPCCRDKYVSKEFNALILTPLGLPVLPCSVEISSYMLVDLLKVVKYAHEINWIHRDIKPDNIYIAQNDNTRIVLNDWSSASKKGVLCDFVGTWLFGDQPDINNQHKPEPCTDLRSLVRTVYCLSKQRMPLVNENAVVEEYWKNVEDMHPLFKRAMRLADAVDYKDLETLFLECTL
jgi:serine/threonine protein kinase